MASGSNFLGLFLSGARNHAYLNEKTFYSDFAEVYYNEPETCNFAAILKFIWELVLIIIIAIIVRKKFTIKSGKIVDLWKKKI